MTLGTLGKYQLLSRLPSGGMADLYRALSIGPDGFRRLVAIKRIRPEFGADPEFRKMFADEAAIASRLNHSNIAQVYEFNVEDGEPYIVMEFVEGKDLRSILMKCRETGRPLPYPMALFTAAKAADGLHFVHTRKEGGRPLQIVHRDISPQNIMISHAGEVKILDFGIARAACRLAETQTGVIKGKYAYMSPEQVRCRPLDQRSDIFSLGVVLWEMLTLKRLFWAENEVLTAQNVCEKEAPAPHLVRPELPKDLAPILARALAKDPAERYSTVQEFRDDLSMFLMSSSTYPTPDQVASFIYDLFPQDMESLRQGEHLIPSVEEAPPPPEQPQEFERPPELNELQEPTRPVKVRTQELPSLRISPLPDAPPSSEPTSALLEPPVLPEALAAPSDEGSRQRLRRWAFSLSISLLVVLLALAGIAIYRVLDRSAQEVAQRPASASEASQEQHQTVSESIASLDQDRTPDQEQNAADKPPVASIDMTVDVEPPDAYVFVDGNRLRPGRHTFTKTPGQPIVLQVTAANYLPQRRVVDAEDGARHTFRLREAGYLTFVVNPADCLVEVDGKKAIGTRGRFGWEGAAGDSVHVKVSHAGLQSFEEEVVIPRGDMTRTYRLAKSAARLVDSKVDERPAASAKSSASADSAKPAPQAKDAPKPESSPSPVAALLKPVAPSAPGTKTSPNDLSKPVKTTSPKPSAKSPAPAPAEQPAATQPPASPTPPPAGKGTIRVNARPYAEIFYKGKPWGQTPKDIEADAGPHEVLLKHPSGNHTCRITVEAGKPVTCFFDFEPPESGSPSNPAPQKTP